jgi:hypothetical protein
MPTRDELGRFNAAYRAWKIAHQRWQEDDSAESYENENQAWDAYLDAHRSYVGA